jgi:hypothetical protein
MRAVLPIAVAILALVAAPAQAQSGAGLKRYAYKSCAPVAAASVVRVVGAPCAAAQEVAAQLVAAAPAAAGAVLRAAGWTLVRARSAAGGDAHDLVATRYRAALRIRRAGAPPDADGWEAGRELLFARGHLVGGRPIPSGAVLCTSSWLVRVRGGSLGGLSAAHCGGLRRDRTVQRHNVVLRRQPQHGIVLGRVQRILTRSRPLDALIVPIPRGAGRSRVPLVDRGVSRPPWIVAGLARARPGREVCFAGRTSGAQPRARRRAVDQRVRRRRRALHLAARAPGRQRRPGLHRAGQRRPRARRRDRHADPPARQADVLHAAGARARRARRPARRCVIGPKDTRDLRVCTLSA